MSQGIDSARALVAPRQIAPSAMASSVTSASGVARWLVNPAVGLLAYLAMGVIVAAAAPTISRTAQEMNTPRPDHRPVALRLLSGGR